MSIKKQQLETLQNGCFFYKLACASVFFVVVILKMKVFCAFDLKVTTNHD